MSIPLSDLDTKELRTLWNCMQLSNPSEFLELAQQEIEFIKEFNEKMKASFSRNSSGSAIKEGEKRTRIKITC